MRLIDADTLLEIIRRDWSLFQGATYIGDQARRDELTNVIAEIINAPTIDPVRHGEWIATEDPWFRACSVCGYLEYECVENNYCPECGAKMDGGKE